jgi:hypothetical protein
MTRPIWIATAALGAVSLAVGRPSAQDAPPASAPVPGAGLVSAAQEEQEGPLPLPPELTGGPSSPEQELRRLFREVEETLRRIDDQLFEAAAGENDLGAADAEIDRLLRETESASRRVVEGIDEILQVASQMNQSGGQPSGSSGDQGGQSPPQGGGESPIDQQEQGGRQERMQGEQPPEQGQGGSRPDDGRGDDAAGRNAPGQDPAESERGAGSAAQGADRWGDLPPRVQTIFQNQVDDDLPVRYRDWIDRYHRRLNG